MKEIQLQSLKGKISKNIQNHFIDTLSFFFYKSSQERKYILKMGNVHIILQFGTHLEYLTLFNVIIRASLRLMQSKINVDFLFWVVY